MVVVWRKVLLISGAALPLAGCMTAGTNMHGDFACRAPGGTCAPMSTIDARAVATMGAGVRPVGDTTMPGIPGRGRVVTASADGTPPVRTSDRVLRVVFPAHIDASGIYHDEASAHAVVEHSGWTDGLTGGARIAQAVASVVAAGPAHGDTAADGLGSKLATINEIIAARAAHGMASSGPAPQTGLADRAAPAVLKPGALRSVTPIDLREAAAAATALPVAGLDPNYDTPDVRAIVADDARQGAGLCVGYRTIRWHGRLHRKSYSRPCAPAVQPAAPMVAYAPPTTPQPTLPFSAPANPVAPPKTARLATKTELPLVHFGEADDRAAAAARLKALAAPALPASRPAMPSPAAAVTPVDQLFAGGAAPFATVGGSPVPAAVPQP